MMKANTVINKRPDWSGKEARYQLSLFIHIVCSIAFWYKRMCWCVIWTRNSLYRGVNRFDGQYHRSFHHNRIKSNSIQTTQLQLGQLTTPRQNNKFATYTRTLYGLRAHNSKNNETYDSCKQVPREKKKPKQWGPIRKVYEKRSLLQHHYCVCVSGRV